MIFFPSLSSQRLRCLLLPCDEHIVFDTEKKKVLNDSVKLIVKDAL